MQVLLRSGQFSIPHPLSDEVVMNVWRMCLFTMALCVELACASAPTNTADAAASSTITTDEIKASGLPTGFDVVDRLRPRWKRDLTTNASVSVYLDQRRLGGLETLRDVPTQDIRELQYMKGSEAELRWGHDARGGAIIVVRP